MLRLWQSEMLFSKAQKLFRQERCGDSIALYRKALDANPKSAGIRLHLAIALAENGDYCAALDNVNQAILLQPKNPVQPMFLGLIHFDYGYYDQALQAFEKAGQLDPGYQFATCLKHLTYFAQGRLAGAGVSFGKNYHWGVDFESRLLLLCELYLKRHADAGSSFFQSELRATGANASRYDNPLRRLGTGLKYGLIQFMNGVLFDRTAGDIKKAYFKAKKSYALGDIQQALRELQKVVEQPAPSLLPKALNLLTEIYLEIGDLVNFLNSIPQIPEYRATLDFLTNSSARPTAVADYPALHTELLLALGIVYHETGELSRAQDALLIAVGLDGKNYLGYYYLGLCELARVDQNGPPGERYTIHNFRAALFWFKKALNEVNPKLVAKRTAESIRVFENTGRQ